MPAYQIPQNIGNRPLVFLLVSTSDHITGLTGLSPTVTISKNGGTFASPSGAVTEIGNGFYKVAGNTTDSNTKGPLMLHATATGADPSDTLYEVIGFDNQVGVYLDFTQAVPTSNTAQTTGDALNGARAQAFGNWALVGTTLTMYAANGSTVVRTFTLDSATNPTSRT